jgi:hypothetical protein
MAVGGTTSIATDEFDSLTQMHVMLETPRSGVMLLPAFQAGETAPQPFVPLDVQSYITLNANLRTTYDRTVALVDQFRYQGSVDKFVKENISDKLGIDFLSQVLDNLKGRYTWMSGFPDSSKRAPGVSVVPFARGEQFVLAAELIDEEAAKDSLKTVIDKYPQNIEERRFGNVTYYAIQDPDASEEERANAPIDPCVAIMDGYLFLSMSCQRFEHCVAARDGTVERLVDSSDYARTSTIIGRETVGITPVLFSLRRPEVALRHWYGVLTSEETRTLIDENKADNPVLSALADVMDEHKLPPFDVLARYMAPGGGILYDTDSGYHVISFDLRNDVKPEEQAAAESK